MMNSLCIYAVWRVSRSTPDAGNRKSVAYAEREIEQPYLGTSVFRIPREQANGEERVVALNREAMLVIEGQRGLHSEHVFPYRGHRVSRKYNSAWKPARGKAVGKYMRVLRQKSLLY